MLLSLISHMGSSMSCATTWYSHQNGQQLQFPTQRCTHLAVNKAYTHTHTQTYNAGNKKHSKPVEKRNRTTRSGTSAWLVWTDDRWIWAAAWEKVELPHTLQRPETIPDHHPTAHQCTDSDERCFSAPAGCCSQSGERLSPHLKKARNLRAAVATAAAAVWQGDSVRQKSTSIIRRHWGYIQANQTGRCLLTRPSVGGAWSGWTSCFSLRKTGLWSIWWEHLERNIRRCLTGTIRHLLHVLHLSAGMESFNAFEPMATEFLKMCPTKWYFFSLSLSCLQQVFHQF